METWTLIRSQYFSYLFHTDNYPNPQRLKTTQLCDSQLLLVRSSGEAQLVLVQFHEIAVKISAQA